jgi:DNA polymerase
MSDAFRQLLDATIAHLDDLAAHGTRFVPVAPATLAALAAARPRRTLPATSAVSPPAPPAVRAMPKPPTAPAAPAILNFHSPPAPLSPAEKEARMAALRERVLPCRKCEHLAAARRNVVFGVGDIHSPLMFVGEAPGADEDAQGEPFVGRAGQLLTKIIQTMGLGRDRVYIANILKCRPDTPGQTAGNRKPTPAEMHTCLPYLLEQIQIIQPRVMVALGATAIEGLFGRSEGITRLRGNWLEFQGVPVMPTYHPAYLLRNQALAEKRKVWEDMLAVMTKLGLPISEKQRGFFLKA